MVEAELRQHGVPRDVVEALRDPEANPRQDAEAERPPETEEERARIALERHLRGRPLPADARALQRVGMFLMRRGFDPETVRATLRSAAHRGELPTDD
jgi:SOS response regulatory protein OraA/RecX